MKGWRTLLFGFVIAVAPSALHYLAGVHWADYLSPNLAFAVAGAVSIALRVVTNTDIGKSA
jgi:hypothetical protein